MSCRAPDGIYRVGPLGRLKAAESCGTPEADVEFKEYHQRFGKMVERSFHFHYARLVETIYALEKMELLLDDQAILDRHVRATAGVNALEGMLNRAADRSDLSGFLRTFVATKGLIGGGPDNLSGPPFLCSEISLSGCPLEA